MAPWRTTMGGTGCSTSGSPSCLWWTSSQTTWRMGVPVRIFTARVCNGDPETRKHIEDWCLTHLGVILPVTCIKDYGMTLLYDDRAVAV